MRNIWSVLSVLMAAAICFTACQTQKKVKRRVAVVFSYDEAYEGDHLEQLRKEWQDKGIDAELKVFYSNYARGSFPQNRRHILQFLDSIAQWKADLLMIKDDEAFNTLLHSNAEVMHQIPVLYCSVSFPDWEDLSHFNNIRGFWENPNYNVNIRLMENLIGGGRIHLDYRPGSLGQLSFKAEKETFSKIHFPYTERYILDPYLAIREPIDTATHACFIPFWKMRGDSLLQYYHKLAHSPHALFLDNATYRQEQLGESYSGLVFTTVSDMFYHCDQCIGGYFAPRESIWKEWGDMAADMMTEEILPLNMTQEHRQQFVFNYRIVKRWGISMDRLPDDAVIVGQPLLERYQWPIIATFLSLFGLLCIVLFAVRVYRRNYRKNLAFLKDVHNGHRHLLHHFGGKNNVMFNMVGTKIYFDRSFLDLLNCPEEYITADAFHAFAHPDDREMLDRERVRLFHELNVTLSFRADFDGKGYQHYQIRCGSLKDSKRKTVVAGIILNVEQEYLHNENLKRTAQLAKESLEKTSFFDSITHEIRTPLNAITGFTDFLISEESQYISEEDRQIFKREIATNNEKLTNIIEDILELSRIDSGKAEFLMEETNLNDLVTECYNKNRERIKPELSFVTDLTPIPLWVKADRKRLFGVLDKLITNANKFTTQGSILLTTWLDRETGVACIAVEDTGCGIEKEKQHIIMHRFYKVETMSQGTGLGLSICQAVINRMDGQITVESEYGKGSKFIVSLPFSH